MESKMRVLVSHEEAKFMVLISATKTVKELKNELLKTYNLISGQVTCEGISVSNSLHLLAYDGYIVCDHFTLYDALYDGCVVTTTYEINCDSSSSYRCCSCHYKLFANSALHPARPPFYPHLPVTIPYHHNSGISLQNHPYYLSNYIPCASVDSQEVAPNSVESCNNPSSVVGTPPLSIYHLTPTIAEMPNSSQLKDTVSNSNEKTQEVVSSEGRDVTVTESSPDGMKKDFPNEKSIENSSDVYEFNDDSCTSEAPIVTPSDSTRKRKGALSKEIQSKKIKKMSKDIHGVDDMQVQIIPQSRKRKLDGEIKNNTNNILSKPQINQKYPLTSNIAEDCCSSLSSWSSVEEDIGASKSVAEKIDKNLVEEEELSSDSSSSSDEEDKVMHAHNDQKKQSSSTLRALAVDADKTLQDVQRKSSMMVPGSCNLKKKLLQRTSLLKKGAPLSIEKSKSKSIPLSSSRNKLSRKAISSATKSLKKQPLHGLSQQEEQIALNLSHNDFNVSRVLNNEKVW